MTRPSWDTYFLGIAEAVAARSDCERSKVGAVVVKEKRIRATGYNGAPAKQSGCDTCPRRTARVDAGVSDYDSGHTRCVAIHAEANALLYCDRGDLVGSTLYITREPCPGCTKLIAAAGIVKVMTPERLVAEENYSYPLRFVSGWTQEWADEQKAITPYLVELDKISKAYATESDMPIQALYGPTSADEFAKSLNTSRSKFESAVAAKVKRCGDMYTALVKSLADKGLW